MKRRTTSTVVLLLGVQAAVATYLAGAAASPAPPTGPATNLQLKVEGLSPDKAWDDLIHSLPSSQPPAEWQTTEPTREQVAQYEKRNAELAAQAADRARAFYTNFPNHAKSAQARQLEYQLLSAAVQLGNTGRKTDLDALEDARLKDPKSTEDDRFEVRMRRAMRPFMRPPEGDRATALADLEKTARSLQGEFPKRQEVYDIFFLLAQAYFENNNLEKCRALTAEIAQGGSGEARQNAEAMQRRLGRLGQPLGLRFVSLEGEDFDLKKLQGKVVLLDFWATTSSASRSLHAEIKAACKKYRDQGLEIVGISLDEAKSVLQKYLAEQNITWPQYYDGRGWENKWAREFEVASIPTLWLVDRKGNLRELNARENLTAKIEKLLAEK